jgi:hypothetical protein
MEKKTWHRPELISLTRTKPQESVLSTCKRTQMQTFGPASSDSACIIWTSLPACLACTQTEIS